MANRNFASGGKIYSMHVKPVLIDCNFIVDSADADGLGITSLKGPMVQNVFMNTSATPGEGNRNPSTPNIAVTNPDPAAGTIIIQLQDRFSRSFSGFNAVASPNSGAALKVDNSVLAAGVPYIITTLGNFTAAQWAALGIAPGITPAVGLSFISSSVGAGANTSTSRVMTAATAGSNIATIETVGNSNLSLNPSPTATQGFGAQIILQCRDYTGAIVAPATGTLISVVMYLSDSSITTQGE